MPSSSLEDFLEDQSRLHFYDLLGGLADNLLTIGTHSGTFLSCSSCGDTFTLKGESWSCEACGNSYELKFKPAPRLTGPFETKVQVTGLDKPRLNPHWYFENENWSVAEFLTQLLRLQPELFMRLWFAGLGVPLVDSPLETVLCWPRFKFGGKTIQPDLAVGFEKDVVFVEFKRPKGGAIPPVELMGQFVFLEWASKLLGRRWHFLLVPGRDNSVKGKRAYVQTALDASDDTQKKWRVPESALESIEALSQDELASRVHVYGWESLLQKTLAEIEERIPESWSKRQAVAKLEYFRTSRGLFSPG